jgi:ribonuclease HII
MKRPLRKLILGIDEAGYGPNLGPLVIACSVWLVNESSEPSIPAAETMLDRLSPLFLPQSAKLPAKHIPLGDSKAIFASGDSIDRLSMGVRFWLRQVEIELSRFQGVLDAIAPSFTETTADLAWYQPPNGTHPGSEIFRGLDEMLPVAVQRSALKTVQAAGLQFLGLSAVAIDERRFNREVERFGNKATLLSQASMSLVSECLDRYVDRHDLSFESIHVYCDKHGGRSRYQTLLMDVMPEVWFEVIRESPTRSDYQAKWRALEMQWSFLAKGDRLFASALASMTAKWIREGLMSRLNAYWQTHLPNLKPTAGYPVDAKRFRTAIEPFAKKLKYPIENWWRSR